MTKSAHPERETQNRIITFFQKELGYKHLGNLLEDQNYNIRWGDWKKFLYDSGFSVDFVDVIQTNFYQILSDFSQSPYHTNKEVYRILKYGLKLAEYSGATSDLIPFSSIRFKTSFFCKYPASANIVPFTTTASFSVILQSAKFA